MEQVYAGYTAVIPYFEKARELNPTERNTLTTLKELYFKLRNNDPSYMQKYEEVKAELEK